MLTLTNIRKSYGTSTAVDDLSLQIRPGEVFGLLGPNGAGKSTTISMATGLLAPDSGSVIIEGIGPPTLPEVRAKIGVAPQSLALYIDLTAMENLLFFGRLYGLDGAAILKRADEVLDMVGLRDRKADRVKAYSGGMQRRLNLAVALMHDPPMLLLDEPTAGVDPQSRNNILELVRTLRGEGRTIVYTTHYMEEAARLCDRVAIIDKGKILALGSVHELIQKHGGGSVVTVTRQGVEHKVTTEEPLREIARVMDDQRDTIENVRIDRPDLEGVFLTLTGRSLRD